MKIRKIVIVLVAAIGIITSSCSNKSEAVREAATQKAEQNQASIAAPAATETNPATPTEPAQNAVGVWHYTCPKGCEGGAGAAVACTKCGTTLAHNSTYHAGATPPATPQTIVPKEGGNVGTVPSGFIPVESPLKKTEAAQNSNGVWHYTCPAGCAGGAGLATGCSKCGKTLVHNQAYHQ